MITIIEDYVSFEVAKLLKEKGFNWDCITYYVDFEPNDVKYSMLFENNTTWEERCYSAPTLQMAMKWLREVHNIDIIVPPQYDNIKWTYSAVIIKLSIPCTEIRLNDNKDKKEEACEAALKYCLEHLI